MTDQAADLESLLKLGDLADESPWDRDAGGTFHVHRLALGPQH